MTNCNELSSHFLSLIWSWVVGAASRGKPRPPSCQLPPPSYLGKRQVVLRPASWNNLSRDLLRIGYSQLEHLTQDVTTSTSWCGGVVGVAPLLSASPESPNSSLCRSGRAHPPFRGTLFLLLVAMKTLFVLKKNKFNSVIKTIKPRSADFWSLSTTMLCLFCQVFVSFGYFMLNFCFPL